MSVPLVSVVIPTFNRAAVLGDAIDSVRAQGIAQVEVVVVDDGSTDATRELAARYGAVYSHQPNRGPAAARNRGVGLARGQFLSFLDSDDLWLPGKVAAELAVFDRRPDLDALISDSEIWRLGTLVTPSRFAAMGCPLPAGREVVGLDEIPLLWIDHSLFSTCCLTLRRSAIEKLGAPLFDESLTRHEDWEMELRLYHRCRVGILPRVLARVRRFDDGTRGGRPLPGGELSGEEERRHLAAQLAILDRLADLPATDAVRRRWRDRQRELRELLS